MKKVRNLLILLLATLMLTVFVGCSGDTPEPTPDPEPEPTKVGDLIISKVYIGENLEEEDANGNAPRDYKFFALTNTGSEDIDLTNYVIGHHYSETDSRKIDLPKLVMAPGVTVYFCNGYNTEAIPSMFPGIAGLPRAKEGEKVTVDSKWAAMKSVSQYYKGESTYELGKDPVSIGKEGDFDIWSWTKVDQVLVNGENPTVASALIRNYDATTKVDNGWTVIDWNAADKIAKMDADSSVRADFSYATFKAEFDKGNPKEMSKDISYIYMNDTEMAALKEAAANDGINIFIAEGKFCAEKPLGKVYSQEPYGAWYLNDYTYDTFMKNYNKGKLGKYPKYTRMSVENEAEFKKLVDEGVVVTVDRDTKTFSVKFNDKAFATQVNGEWTIEDTSKAGILAGYDLTNPKDYSKLPTEKLITMNVPQFDGFKASLPEGWTAKKDNGKFVITFPDTETHKRTLTQTFEGETTTWAYVEEELTPDVPDVPETEPEKPEMTFKADEKILNDIVVTEVYLGAGSCKYFAIKNVSDKAVSLEGYSYEKAKNLTEKALDTITFPAATLNSGCTIYVLGNKTVDEFKTNTNLDFSSFTEVNDTTKSIESDAVYITTAFSITNKYNMYFGKGERSEKEVINCGIDTYHYFYREYDKTNKTTGWNVIVVPKASNDKPGFEKVAKWINWNIKN